MGLKHRILCMLSKHSTNWASSLVTLIFHKGFYYIAPADLELATHLSLRQTHNFPAFASQTLGLWACATMPSFVRWFVYTSLCVGVMHAVAWEWSETNFRCRSSPCMCLGQGLLLVHCCICHAYCLRASSDSPVPGPYVFVGMHWDYGCIHYCV